MFVLFGILEGDGDGATHIIVFVIDGQLYLILAAADLVVFDVFLEVELDLHFHSSRYSPEERGQLVLC